MTLYEQLEADPTLKVCSKTYGVSVKDGIYLRSKAREYPIQVEFENGDKMDFTLCGCFLISAPDDNYDIKIYQP